MTPTERLQAAIDRLTELRDRSTPGEWYGARNILGVLRVKNTDHYIVAEVYGDDETDYSNAGLIATLHNALPQILEILEGAHRYMLAFGDDAHEYVIALADAILGAAS